MFATVILTFMIMTSGVLELVQELVPGRTGRLADWAASSVGAILGALLSIILGKVLVAKRR